MQSHNFILPLMHDLPNSLHCLTDSSSKLTIRLNPLLSPVAKQELQLILREAP